MGKNIPNTLIKNLFVNNKSFFSEEQLQAWDNIRGWLPYSAGKILYSAVSALSPEYGKHVEVGCYAGRSTICIASALLKFYPNSYLTAIDINFQSDFDSNVKFFELSKHINKIQGESTNIAVNWEDPICFLFIDADHSEQACIDDVFSWDKYMVKKGILALDDTAGAFYLGPALAEAIIMTSQTYNEIISIGGVSLYQKVYNIQNHMSSYNLALLKKHIYIRHTSSVCGALDIGLFVPQTFYENKTKVMTKLKNALVLINNIEKVDSEEMYYTIQYLKAIIEIQFGNYALSLEKLTNLLVCNQFKFIHYNLSIKPFVYLRIGQLYDILGARKHAKVYYNMALNDSDIDIIQSAAKLFLSKHFMLNEYPKYKLLRSYYLNSKFINKEIKIPKRSR